MRTFIKTLILISSLISSSLFADWNLSFDENSSSLQADNGSVKIAGSFSFSNNGNNWKIADSRDGVKNRLAIVDNKGDVQGYITFPENSNRLEIFFYHRTAQSYKGRLSFNGKISFLSDAFACSSIPQKGERVLQLGVNSPDSAICDSLFSPQSDTMLRIFSDSVKLSSLGNGSFAINAIPSGTESINATELLRDILSDIAGNGNIKSEINSNIAFTLARDVAIRPETELSNQEMNSIINELFATESPNYTPDGKLIVTIIPQENIEKLFS